MQYFQCKHCNNNKCLHALCISCGKPVAYCEVTLGMKYYCHIYRKQYRKWLQEEYHFKSHDMRTTVVETLEYLRKDNTIRDLTLRSEYIKKKMDEMLYVHYTLPLHVQQKKRRMRRYMKLLNKKQISK